MECIYFSNWIGIPDIKFMFKLKKSACWNDPCGSFDHKRAMWIEILFTVYIVDSFLMLAILRTNLPSECLKHYAIKQPLSPLSSVISLTNAFSEAQCRPWSKGKVSLNNGTVLNWNSSHKQIFSLGKTYTQGTNRKTIFTMFF